MPSLPTRLWRVVLRVAVKRVVAKRYETLAEYVAGVRTAFERNEASYRKVPADIRIVPISSGGIRGEWVMRRVDDYGERALLYVHGGGMIAKSALGYRAITIPLARALRVPIFALDYSHAPEHPFPTALLETIAAVRALRTRVPAAGIVIAGDSAGGNLALAAVLALRERTGEPRPVAGIVALSPWTDLAASGASIRRNAASDDTLASTDGPFGCGEAYAPRERWREPLVSPLYGDYTGGPPMLVFASTSEILLDDARALVARVRAQGGIATLIQEADLPHAWPIYGFLPEARAAVETIADFARRAWHAA